MFAIVLCAVIGMAWGQGSPCCTPDVWEGEFRSFAGYVIMNTDSNESPLTRNDHSRILYDYQEKKRSIFYTSFYEDETSRSYRYIGDYNAKMEYVIYENQCQKRNLTTPMRKYCVDEDSHYAGEIFYGAGNSMLTVKRYYNRIVTSKGQDIGGGYFTVTKDACVPVESVNYAAFPGYHSLDVVRSGYYVNIVPTIRDREDLVPPETCHMATEDELIEWERLPNYHLWYSTFDS